MGDGGEAMTLFIHYRAEDGEIFGWETSSVPTERGDLEIVSFPEGSHLEPKLQKIDTASLTLVDKTDAEKAAANAPTLRQLQEAVFKELCRTDSFVVPDRPMTDATRAAWSTHRQMLRDLSKLATPADMINAWPTPPDGVDPITNLKK